MPLRCRRCALVLLTLAPGPALADSAFAAVSDQNPLIRGAYLPLPPVSGAPASAWSLAAGLQWSNTVNIEATPAEQLTVDEETVELDLQLAHAVGAWRLRATLPVISRNGGILDGPIDDWHRLLGLPQGDRPLVASNAFRIHYANAAGAHADGRHGTALGDFALEAGRQLLEADGGRLALFAGVELPTGGAAILASDRALDAALWLEAGHDFGARFSLDGRAGISRTGGSLPLPAERRVEFGTLALAWHESARLDLTLQFDGHTRIVAGSALKFLSHAVLLTVGGRWQLASGSRLEFGFSEDIEVDHSPDVSFHLGWRWPLATR
jgi:hypothetical protein